MQIARVRRKLDCMEIQLESKLTTVYTQVLRTVLVLGPIAAGSSLPLFYPKADPLYEEFCVFQPEKDDYVQISVMTKAWKCPNFGSGQRQLLAVGTRNLMNSGTRQLLALEIGQLIAAENRQLSASGTTELLVYGTGSGLRDQLHASGSSYSLLEPVTRLWNQLFASVLACGTSYSLLYSLVEPVTRLWNQLLACGTSYALLEPVTRLWNQLLACGTSYALLETAIRLWNQLCASGNSYSLVEPVTRLWNQLRASRGAIIRPDI